MPGTSVTFFANTRLKGKRIASPLGDKVMYPLYATLMYGQTNTHLRMESEGIVYLVSEDLHELGEEPLTSEVDRFTEKIINIIRTEENYFGEHKYQIGGIAKRLKLYRENVVSFLLEMKVIAIVNAVKHLELTAMTDQQNSLGILQALTTLHQHKTSIKTTIFDWQFENGKEEVRQFLNSQYEDQALINTVIALFDYSVVSD